ncbi:MAG: AsnC family transcriptional regulator [Halobacteriota archaeon]|nr:AsnC family transcriptional regulator [Halobacteriota archaeon]
MNLDERDKKILNTIQTGIPLVTNPFLALGDEIGISEDEIIKRLKRLKDEGALRRVGVTINKEEVGKEGTLIAMKVPEEEIDSVAEIINAYDEVTHNYVRSSDDGKIDYNLWFTITGTKDRIEQIADEVGKKAKYPLLNLPADITFKIGVKFDIR